MDDIRKNARLLLFTDIHHTEFSPIVVQHPFTSSGFAYIKDEGGAELLNILDGNDLERWRKAMLKEIERAKTVKNILCMVNNPYRLTFLSMVMDSLTPEELGSCLSYAYTLSEFPLQNVGQKSLLKMFHRASKESLMTPNELAHLDALSDTVHVYRGVQSKNKRFSRGMSWTLDPDTALWFATRFHSDGVVYAADISKKHILAYYDARNEHEVVVEPRHLENIRELDPVE